MTQKITGTNIGPTAPRGGTRKNAGRPSLTQLRLRELAALEGKTNDQIVSEVNEGYTRALRIVATALPDILISLTSKAMKPGNDDIQKFLVTLYFKYAHSAPLDSEGKHSPIARLRDGLRQVIEEAKKHGTVTDGGPVTYPIIEGSGYTIPESPAEPNPVVHPS